MAKAVKLPQLAWYEPKELALPLDENWQVEVCNMAGYDRQPMSDDQIRFAINNPIGQSPIRKLAKGKNEVVILFDDCCRVTRAAKIVPFILEELAEAGIPDHKIRFIAATAAHAAMDRTDFVKKLGEETLARFPVYNHNPFSNCTYVGTTKYGTKVSINTEVMQCDFKIAISCITPHPFVGFGGGRKILLPGVASIETIMANHAIPIASEKNKKGNPIRLDIDEGGNFVGLDVSIECIVNLWGDTVAIFAGEPDRSHAAGVFEAKTHYKTPMAMGKDVVIANTYARVNEAGIGAELAFPSVSDKGGDVVLICNAPQGQVVHYLLGWWGKSLGGSMKRLEIPIPKHVNHLIVYTEYPDLPGLGCFEGMRCFKATDKVLTMNKWDDVLSTLKNFHKGNVSVGVYPNADIQYFG